MHESGNNEYASGNTDDAAHSGMEIPEDAMIILAVRNTVMFPGIILPLSVGRPQSVAAAQEAASNDKPIGVILQSDPDADVPSPRNLHGIGTVCEVLRYVTAPDGIHHIVCRGDQRFRTLEFLPGYPYLVARVIKEPEPVISTVEIEARVHQLKSRAHELIKLLPNAGDEMVAAIDKFGSPAALADFVMGAMDFKAEDKQSVLETFDVAERLDRVLKQIAKRIEVLKLSRQISEKTQESLSAKQREHLLREQLQQIRSELGEGDEKNTEIAELRDAVGKAQMPEEVEKQALKELRRLERMSESMSEYALIRTYLDWLIELPWVAGSAHKIDLLAARRILDEDHYGLDKIKKRILEFLAVRKLNPDGKSPILCFVGPPGVGKTSLGRSIARAIGVEFVRISLGGVHDEAEIRGHRRTYVGAMPGNIIQSVRKAGTTNPLFMLDEMDKLSASMQGDPSSALLEVLDPEQNATFRDNYLAVPYDLSSVMFIGTANVLSDIPGPLRDRMEVIEIPSYTEDEKLEIARRYLLERQLQSTGLDQKQCCLSDGALRIIIRDYTREAGCRNLEREIGAVCRHAAVLIAEGKTDQLEVDAADLHGILGPARFENEIAMRTSVSGVVTGLAWTPVGGDILFVEANRVPGSGRLILTGQLGDVMKESAQAALTLVKGQAASLGVDEKTFEVSDVHIHVPAGAIPKDGPSAGVAMYTALVSLLTERTVRSDIAMTGEISLRGQVLPIGGVKEKVLAAVRAGIATVLLPKRNRKDLDDVTPEVRNQIEIIWLDNVEDATGAALENLVDVKRGAEPANWLT